MMEGFSPLARRIVAVGVLILLLLLSVNIVAVIASAVGDSRERLEDARFRLARLAVVQKRAPPGREPPVPSSLYIKAGDHRAASAQLMASLNRASAAAAAPLAALQALPPDPAHPHVVQVRVSASGKAVSITKFIEEAEKLQPFLRFQSWSLTTSPNDPSLLLLEATAGAAWGGQP